MKPEQILARMPKVLRQSQREQFFHDGYLVIDQFIGQDWLDRLWAVTHDFIEESRRHTKSNDQFDLEPEHSAENPRLRRLSWPTMQHELYWEFASRGPIVDVAEDLLGGDVMFHHSKLNFKWSGGGEEVKWHQDFPFYPHSNPSVLAIGLYMNDVDDDMGPMGAIAGSQNGPIYNHYNEHDLWTGGLSDADVGTLPLDSVGWMKGNAGSITVHHCQTVHGSLPNNSNRMRPLLINAYKSADARSLTSYPDSESKQHSTLIRGTPARWAELSRAPCRLPPDWSNGYTSIFAIQQKEDNSLDAVK